MTSFSPTSGLCVVDHGDEPAPAETGRLCAHHYNRLDLLVGDIRDYFPDFVLHLPAGTGEAGLGQLHRKVITSPALVNLDVAASLDQRVRNRVNPGDVQGVVGPIIYWWQSIVEYRNLTDVIALDPVPRAYKALSMLPKHHGWIAAQDAAAPYFADMEHVARRVKVVVGETLTIQPGLDHRSQQWKQKRAEQP